MSRVKRGVVKVHRKRKFIKLTKGYYGRANRCYKIARNRYEKGLQYAYISRKIIKRDFKSMFIVRINAFCRNVLNTNYSKFMFIKSSNVCLKSFNSKTLSNLIVESPDTVKKMYYNEC